jgi:hypothetical protein
MMTLARQNLWDDAAFVKRVENAAKKKGMDLQQVARVAGANRFYFDEKAEGRSTNVILNLAEVLNVPAAELLGVANPPGITNDPKRLEFLLAVTRLMEAQVAAFMKMKEP